MQIAILLDENVPAMARQFLESQGAVVLDIRGTAREGCNDKELFSWAQENQAVLLTTDKDFFHTIPWMYSNHRGVVVVTLRQPNAKAILDKLRGTWDHLARAGFENQAYLITDSRIYSRKNQP